jgi:CRISPR-associated protein Cas8a1/Csx13
VNAIEIPAGDYKSLRTFELAVKELAPRVITSVAPSDAAKATRAKVKATKRKSKPASSAIVEKAPEHFWSDSIVRPLVADNLAQGQPWYRGFHDLMTKLDPVSKKPKRSKLSFEKAGLKNMVENVEWKDEGEKAIVLAVHQAIKQRLGQIAGENKGKSGTMRNRMQGEFDKWRLAFSGAKTSDQFRKSICDLFGRAGINPVLKEHWTSIVPWLSSPTKWKLARDLSLLALASYTGTGAKEVELDDVTPPITEVS